MSEIKHTEFSDRKHLGGGQTPNANTMPDLVYLYQNETGIWQAKGTTGTQYIKAPTEPVVPLSEVLELLGAIATDYKAEGEYPSCNAIEYTIFQLKQKYGVSND